MLDRIYEAKKLPREIVNEPRKIMSLGEWFYEM